MLAAWVILPTYNEAGNVDAIVRAALAALGDAGVAGNVLVVDDGSPDGTGEIADRLAEELDAVHVLHRPVKAGLGPAYLAGFDHALGAGADLIIEMDADFSHDPADLPRLVAAAEGADLVLGSRYVRGGRIAGWSLPRRLLSRAGSLYAAALLQSRVRDLTGGFKCFRRAVLEALDLEAIQANGYGFQIELTYRTLRAGFRVREIPITFHDRRAGTSKMTLPIALEAVWKVPALRLQALRG